MCVTAMVWNHDPLQVNDSEWHEIEDEWNIEASNDFVDHSGDFVELRSLHELDVYALGFQFWRMVHNNLQLVVHKGLEVEVADLHDDLEGYEVHDAVLNGVLQGEHVEVDAFCCESHDNLD